MKILDACCVSRMFWFDKENPNVTFMDNGVPATSAANAEECSRMALWLMMAAQRLRRSGND